jgi:hypothetical protein
MEKFLEEFEKMDEGEKLEIIKQLLAKSKRWNGYIDECINNATTGPSQWAYIRIYNFFKRTK